MKAINKQDLINYLKKSPDNLNFNIFGAMLDDFRNTYEADEEVINKIKHIIIDIVKSGDDIKPSDDTISELVEVIAEVLPEKIGGRDITVSESYDISEGTLNSATITLEGDIVATIPDGVTEIGNKAFMGNETVEKIIMPDSVISIEDGVFQYPGSSSNAMAFGECANLKEVALSNNLTSIGIAAFYRCTSLTSITIPDGVTTISNNAFYGCTSLTSITIPDGVTNIGNDAFTGCTSLTDIYYTGTQAQWEQITLGMYAIPGTATIHYNYTPSN